MTPDEIGGLAKATPLRAGRVEPGLVLLCLLELRAHAAPTVDLACSLSDIPRSLRPHARQTGARVRLSRQAALRWVERVAQSRGAAIYGSRSSYERRKHSGYARFKVEGVET